MKYSQLSEKLKKKYGKEYFEICKKQDIDPIKDDGALLLVEIKKGEMGWIINPYYEWF